MNPATIYLVDDEPAQREAMTALFSVAGYRVETLVSGEEFLAQTLAESGCIILDLLLPGKNGLEVLEILSARGNTLPVIILTGYGDIPTTVQAMQAGASDFIQKASAPGQLLDRIEELIRQHERHHDHTQQTDALRLALSSLSTREREILSLAACDFDTYATAERLGISVRTVEVHRSHIAHKCRVENLAALFRIATRHKLPLA